MANRTLLVSKAWQRYVGQTLPIRWWRLADPSGTTATDAMGVGNGTYTGTYTLAQASLIASDSNNAVLLSGGRVALTDDATLEFTGTSAFSIMAWVSHTADGTLRRLFGKLNTGGYLLISSSGGTGLKLQRTDSGGVSDTCTAAGIGTGARMVVGTYDGSNMRLYVGGALVGGPTASTRSLPTTTNVAVIGAKEDGTLNLSGTMDEVAVWDRALTATEIAEMYAAASSTDLIGNVKRNTLRVEQKGYSAIATLNVTLKSTPTVAIPPESELQLTDTDSSILFAGVVRQRRRVMIDEAERIEHVIVGQDYTSLLAEDVVDDSSGLRTTSETDKARITWLMSTYGSKGITVGTEVVQLAASMPVDAQGVQTQDFRGKTLAECLKMIAEVTGAQWYVDQTKKLHYFATESNAAPFNFSDTPNGSTTFGFHSLELPEDTVTLRNAVYVTGNGVALWRTDDPSILAYGRRETGLTDPKIESTAQGQAAGDAYLDKNAWPRTEGTLRTYKGGIKPGMAFTITSALFGMTAVTFRATQVIIDLSNPARTEYTIRFGHEPITLQMMLSAGQASTSKATDAVIDVASVAADVTPPGTVTGVTLTPGLLVGPDGDGTPYMDVSWNAEGSGDLEAYEVELDQANQGTVTFVASASGTGGSLTAGLYYVAVCGVGSVGGETKPGQVQTVNLTTGQRLYVNITAMTGMSSYRVYAERTSPPDIALTTSTTGSNVEVTTEGTTGGQAPANSTAVDFAAPQTARTNALKVTVSPVMGGVYHSARVKAIDKAGNRSASWSSLATAQASKDTSAPEITTGLSAIPGFELVGLTWNRNSESDLRTYEARWYQGSSPPSDTDDWTRLFVTGTMVVITGLTAGVPYVFQVRAIDRSNNVRTSLADPTAVDATANPEAGWSDVSAPYVTATPTLVGAADVAFNTVVTQLLTAGTISATYISGGTLTVGGLAGATTQISVYDSQGRLTGTWANSGLTIIDPANSNRRLSLTGGVLKFSADGGANWSTGMDADGITANAVLLGSMSGGPNAIPNSGFELTPFTSGLSSVTWTTTGDWSSDIPSGGTNRVNVDRSTGDLKLTTYT